MIEQQRMTWKSGTLALTLLLVFGVLVLAPLVLLCVAAIPANGVELEALRRLLSDSPVQQAFLRSMAVALLACGAASVVAIPIAIVALRCSPLTRRLIGLFGVLPLVMPAYLSAAVLQHLGSALELIAPLGVAGDRYAVGHVLTLILVFALHYLPLILLGLLTGLTKIDRSLEESARNLGAGRLAIWRRVILPLATPGYLLGASVMVLRVIEDAASPLVLGVGDMLAPQLLLRLGEAGLADPQLQAGALLLLFVSLLITAFAWSALLPPLNTETDRHCARSLRWRRLPGAVLAFLPLLALAAVTLAPLIWLVLIAVGMQWSEGLLPTGQQGIAYTTLLHQQWPGLVTTFGYAGIAALLTLLLGLLFGALTLTPGPIARSMRFVATAMLGLPGIVLALAYLHASARLDLYLDTSPELAWGALILIVALKQLPLAQRLIARELRALRHGSLAAARNLGAHGPALYLRIGLPALIATLGAVLLFGAVAAIQEVSVALVLIRDPAAPYAVTLFRSLQTAGDPAPWAAQGVLLVSFIATGLAIAFLLSRNACRSRAPIPSQSPRDQA